ncbi:MAG: glycine--tRNA ligase [bacterium]|nr:glycine--tRNA ligase [bacterium]
MDDIIALAKRRGFIYPSSLIYGGLANTWDFGHYGTLLKNNVRDWWWKRFVIGRDDMVSIDASIFLNPKAWEASGHVENFTDVLIDCKICHTRTRADHLIEDKLKIQAEGLPLEKLNKLIADNKIKCPKCGNFDWTPARKFNLLFETKIGIVEESQSTAYLRGEIAQGIFLNFKNIIDTMRVRIPFGIAQQGKVFRNEITLGQFVHRSLEFDLMEFEYFIKESEWQKTYEYWREGMWKWAKDLGIRETRLRWREHEEHERSHYSKRTMDVEYEYPFGFKEMFGLAYRTDFDLKNHSEKSGKDLRVMDPHTGDKYIPHVIEPTFGLSRLIGILLYDAYKVDTVNGKDRVVLKLHPIIAPVKAAVFPLQKDEVLHGIAKKLHDELKQSMVSEFDDSGNIGKMYRRQDEIGTPYCITVDYQTKEDSTVTVRERDTTSQQRLPLSEVKAYIMNKIGSFY